jgi:hypothetical protein
MSHADIKIIDPLQSKIPELAVVQKVLSDGDKLPEDQHDRAVKAFLVSDGIASGIGKDLAFVDKIPQFINEIIDNKLWECLYVAKGVVTPYYCRYIKGADSENFQSFITAKRPNGLETSVETIERVLQAEPQVLRKFQALIYESRQGQRRDLMDDETSPLEGGKLKHTQQERKRAANRAAEAIPVIGELLDRGLIAIEVAALLGRDIKDPKNLTAEEREYVDKRDLIGLRLDQYIYTNPIPEDEDKEPPYKRELNRYVKDLLGIKDRSKPIRMDHPKKAAEKLLQFYQGDKLKELIDHLRQALKPCLESPASESPELAEVLQTQDESNHHQPISNHELKIDANQISVHEFMPPPLPKLNLPALKPAELNSKNSNPKTEVLEDEAEPSRTPKDIPDQLNAEKLAERLNVSYRTLRNMLSPKNHSRFSEWSRKRDPDSWAWQPVNKEKGSSRMFVHLQEQ